MAALLVADGGRGGQAGVDEGAPRASVARRSQHARQRSPFHQAGQRVHARAQQILIVLGHIYLELDFYMLWFMLSRYYLRFDHDRLDLFWLFLMWKLALG